MEIRKEYLAHSIDRPSSAACEAVLNLLMQVDLASTRDRASSGCNSSATVRMDKSMTGDSGKPIVARASAV